MPARDADKHFLRVIINLCLTVAGQAMRVLFQVLLRILKTQV